MVLPRSSSVRPAGGVRAAGADRIVARLVVRWTPTYTFVAVVMAQPVVAMPFLVISVESALRARDVEAEEVAYTLGAGRLTTFWHVTLPMIRTGIGAGALLCFARCLGNSVRR